MLHIDKETDLDNILTEWGLAEVVSFHAGGSISNINVNLNVNTVESGVNDHIYIASFNVNSLFAHFSEVKYNICNNCYNFY